MSELRPGGVEVRTLELLTYLRSEESLHEVVTISGRAGELAPSYGRLGIDVVPMRIRTIAFLYHFVRYLRSIQADVVHAHVDHSNGLIVALARLAGVPTRISHYRSDTPSPTSIFSCFKRRVMKALTNRHASVIAGVSPTVLTNAWSADWHSDNRCLVLLNGIESTPPRNDPPMDLHAELGFNRESRIILHVGRGVPTKNRHRAITVLGALAEKYGSRYCLAFVGRDGADPEDARTSRMELKQLAASLGVEELVSFAGERRDIAQVLQAGDLLLVTSTLEGLPGVILEATAAGLPVVASDLPGVRFIAENDVEVSIVSLDASDSTWASEIKKRLETHTVAANTGLQETIFDMPRVAQSYLDVWHGRSP